MEVLEVRASEENEIENQVEGTGNEPVLAYVEKKLRRSGYGNKR